MPSQQQEEASPGDPLAALPGLIGKWRDHWAIRYEGGMYRAYGRSHDKDGRVRWHDTEICASTAAGLDAELTAWEAGP